MKSECPLIQELLPLYLENDVSDETHKTIDQHLDGCKICKGALEQYVQASDPISIEALSDPFDTTESFKRFIKRAQKYMIGALTVILLMVSVITIGAFIAGQQVGRTITYVESEEDIFDYYADRVPGLRRAQREGNYQNIGRTIDLPEGLGTVYFDKIWYSKEKIYVFCHIKPGEDLGKIKDVQLSGALYWDVQHEGSPIRSIALFGGMYTGEWVSYDGLYYHALGFNNERERFVPVTETVVDEMTIDLNLTYIPRTQPFNTRQEHVQVGAIEFPALFDPLKEQSHTVWVNKSVSMPGGITLDFQDLILEPQKSILKFKASGLNRRTLDRLYGKLATNVEEEIRLSTWASYISEDHYEMELAALNHVPHDVSIALNSIQLVTEEKLSFELDAKAFHDKMTDTRYEHVVNKGLGTYAGTEYTLERLYADDRGLEFTILMKSPAFNDYLQTFMLRSWASEQGYSQAMQEQGKEIPEGRRSPNLVRFTNDKGEVGDMEDYGQTGGGPGHRMSMFIDKGYVERSDRITVDIMNLVETIRVE